MKKLIYKLSTMLIALLVFATACEEEPIMFDSSMNVVGFSNSALTITEDGSAGTVVLYLGAPEGAEATSVVLEVITAGIANPAKEGTDFTLSSKDVNVAVGQSSVSITPIDNDAFTGDKSFMLKIVSNSKGYKTAVEDSVMVTISDNEHPLKNWIGTYTVAAASYGDPGNWDEEWTVTTSPVDGELDQLALTGIAGSTEPVYATLDTDAMTITIAAGQSLGLVAGYGYSIEIFVGDADLGVPDKDVPLEGTIAEGGGIAVDFWANVISAGDYTGYVWDVFNTTWTK